MALFRRQNREAALAQRAAEQAVRSGIQFDPRGPERAAEESQQALLQGDPARAFERSVKAVDRLHDFYVYEGFRNRRPSSSDASVVSGVGASLRALRLRQPAADVRSGVMEATHRLRTISTAIDGVGGDSTVYRHALDELATLAPDVDVSGVFWH
jgi:hypothetical protein